MALANAQQPSLDTLTHDLHTWIDSVRPHGAVVWVDALDGWLVIGHETARRVMRDDTRFTVDDPRFSTAQVIGPSMLSLDGAEHLRHSVPFSDPFRRTTVESEYAESILALAQRLVDELEPGKIAEFRTTLAGPFAVGVMTLVLGLDEVAPDVLRGWYDDIVAAVEAVSAGSPVPVSAQVSYARLAEAVIDAATKPGSFFSDARRTLSDDEIASNAATIMFGGIETGEGMVTNALWHILSTPDAIESVRSGAIGMAGVVEESLRLEPAASRIDRYATQPVTLADAEIAEGDLVMVSLAGANRDPAVFDDPHSFLPGRRNVRQHVAFAHGPHTCPGQHLARLETVSVLRTVIDSLPALALADGSAEQPSGLVFRKPATLHVTW